MPIILPDPNTNEPLIPQTKSFFKNPIFLVVLVFLILILGALAYYLLPKSNTPDNKPKEFAVSDVFVKQADNGQLVEGFPAGLVVDKDAVILASAESVTANPNLRSFGISYKTKLTSKELEKKYLDFIKANNFSVTSNQSKDQGSLSIMATTKDMFKSFSSFTVNSTKSADGEIIVMVTYNTKK
mgnify:FL=1